MIVRDRGDRWQIVLQTDHAELSGQLAERWADRAPGSGSLVVASRRHDDGWAVWERAPMVDGAGKPVNFLDVSVPSHLAFYRAGIAAVTEDDPYAGLLVSMHGAGIYRRRYGRDPALRLTFAEEHAAAVEAFVAEQEAAYPARMADVGVDDERRWRDYELLQLFDRLSLYFCMRDVEAGEEAEIQGLRLQPLRPWRVRCDPFPFGEPPAVFTLRRRVLSKREWSVGDFRRELFALEPEPTEIVVDGDAS